MNEQDLLGQLAARSRDETPPTVDVAARVIARIARGRGTVIDRHLAAVSLCACVLSALAVATTWPAKPASGGLAANDSLAALSEVAMPGNGSEALLQVFEP